MKGRSPQEETAFREARAHRRSGLASEAARFGHAAAEAGLSEILRKGLKRHFTEIRVVWYDFTTSFFFEIIWLLFYFTLGFAQIGYSLRSQIENSEISTSPKFGQILPLTLVLLPFLSLMEAYSGEQPQQRCFVLKRDQFVATALVSKAYKKRAAAFRLQA
ncbi:hypothetical protein RRF57_012888 [Xylaria bambusicola]|uniref:Uncharacterized protein n=1 Tax=Xylaria bambusicola TaxID=326684 RepID=A0AAN7ZDX8_9PEZI